MKRRHWIAFGVAVPTLTILILVSGFFGLFQWSPLNCWHDDVDINTGRVRRTRFLGESFPVSPEVAIEL